MFMGMGLLAGPVTVSNVIIMIEPYITLIIVGISTQYNTYILLNVKENHQKPYQTEFLREIRSCVPLFLRLLIEKLTTNLTVILNIHIIFQHAVIPYRHASCPKG